MKLLKLESHMQLEVAKLLRKSLYEANEAQSFWKERALKAVYKRLEAGGKRKDEAKGEEAAYSG